MRGESAETLAMGGGHAHCGTLVYLGDRFPDSFRNTVLMCNIHGHRVNHDLLRRKGSGYTASHGKDFMIAADPWFMGVTLRTGPDGNVYLSDWSDTGECHTYKPDRDSGRIYKISFGEPQKPPADLATLSDDELVRLQAHRNDWYVRQARRLLQERAAKPGWKGTAVHEALRKTLAATDLDAPRRLRALWALHVTGGIDAAGLLALLSDRSEYLRAWTVQLLCEDGKPTAEALSKFASLAQSDPSPVVRLYLASALQRLPVAERWPVVEGLLSHAEDAGDANLPLMVWYGTEPLVPTNPAKALQLAAASRLPLVREFIARRAVEDAVGRGEHGDLAPLAAALAGATDSVRLDLLKGAREGLRGRKSMKMPDGWPAVYAALTRSANAAVREHAVVLALIFDDPRALADLRKSALTPTAPAAERVAALEALVEKGPGDLVPVLHDLLADRAVRRTVLRGLAAYSDEATPRRVLAVYADLGPEEKQDAVATLASRREYALVLLDGVEKKVVARTDVSAFVARQLHALGDKQVTERLRQVWGEVRDTSPDKREQLTRYKKLLTPGFLERADLRNGRLLFTKTCQQCHTLYGEGGKIGPDLTGSNRANLDYLLSNILDPSAEVAQDYRMSVVTTKTGRTLTGMIVERTPNRLALQTATERLVLAREEVEGVKDSPLSMMPEGQLDPLSKEQVRDLIAYLAGKAQVPLPAEGRKE
jgi:putative heme-binding domain-containing protein